LAGHGPCHDASEQREESAMNVTCPECGAEWELTGVEQGEIVTCPDCGVDLEVLSTEPMSVGLAPEEGEDWGE
jgi:alpha-aminoadipate carrier protein LysW